MKKLKPGDEGYLNEAGRRRYLVYICILSILSVIFGYFVIKTW